MSEQNTKSLVERYYTWEKLVLVTSLLLLFRQVFGLIDTTAIPLLDAVLHDPNKFPHAVSIILVIESLFMWIEWKQSDEIARQAPLTKIRFGITFAIAFFDVWINASALTKGTTLESVSRFWYVFYFLIGLTIGLALALNYPGVKELNATVKAKTGQPTNPSVGPAYATVKVAAAAIERAGSLDRAAIRDALAATDMNTVVGHVKFNAKNARVGVIRPVVQWQGGTMELIWPDKQKTKPFVYPIPYK